MQSISSHRFCQLLPEALVGQGMSRREQFLGTKKRVNLGCERHPHQSNNGPGQTCTYSSTSYDSHMFVEHEKLHFRKKNHTPRKVEVNNNIDQIHPSLRR